MKKLTADDPETRSADLVAENIERLKALFPEARHRGAGRRRVNVDVLKQLVGDQTVTDCDEKYGLNWHGKRRARQLALTPSTGTLRPCPEDSVDWDTTQNLMIEGDNLEVLKLLQKSYAREGEAHLHRPAVQHGQGLRLPGQLPGQHQELPGADRAGGGRSEGSASNTEASGRFHTDWLNMMYPRLTVARSLMRDDGVLLVSIDDTELPHLRLLLGSLYGEENFIGSFVWQGGRKNDARLISLGHDYIVVYARSLAVLRANETRWRERKDGLQAVYHTVAELCRDHGSDYARIHQGLLKWYRELPEGHTSKAHDHFNYVDERGVYYPDNLRSPNPRPNLRFEWKGYQPHPNGWAYGPEKMAELDRENRLVYPESHDQRIKIKSYLHEHEDWAPGSVFYKDRRSASKELATLLGAEAFDFPKDVAVMRRLIAAICGPGDLVLDFFAGSGTTGHAVMAEGSSPKDSKRFILVQLPEPLDPSDKNQRAGALFCDRLGKPRNIAEIAKERLRRASAKIKGEAPLFGGDCGFRVFKLDTSNIRTWEPIQDRLDSTLLDYEEHLRAGRTEADVLYEVLLKRGLDLCVPIEVKAIGGKSVHSVGGGVLIACLAGQISRDEVEPLAEGIVAWHRELAPAGDTTCVFRDSAFADDVAKTNLSAILSQHGIKNVRSL